MGWAASPASVTVPRLSQGEGGQKVSRVCQQGESAGMECQMERKGSAKESARWWVSRRISWLVILRVWAVFQLWSMKKVQSPGCPRKASCTVLPGQSRTGCGTSGW